MENLSEVIHMKIEPNNFLLTSEIQKIEKQEVIIKQESDLVHSEVDIKIEPLDDGITETADFTCETSSNYYVMSEINQVNSKMRSENQENDILQNPLDLNNVNNGVMTIIKQPFENDIESETSEIYTDESNIDAKYYGSQTCGDHNSTVGRDNEPEEHRDKQTKDKEQHKYLCDVCEKKFKYKHTLKHHRFLHTDIKPYKCYICEKAFKSSSNLKAHMLIHIDKKPHVCDICEKSFRHKGDLVRHKIVHSGSKPYSCDLCDKRFAFKASCARHRRIHMYSEEKPFSCVLCKEKFANSRDLVKHRNVHLENST